MKRIKALRRDLGWSRSELARRASMQANTVGWVEEGRFIPYDSQLKKLAEALGAEEPKSLLEEVAGDGE